MALEPGSSWSSEWLSRELSLVDSFEDLAQGAARVCARAAHAEICTFWRVYREGESRRLRLAAAEGVSQPQTLAQEVTYAITPGARQYDGVTGYVASEGEPVLVHSFRALRQVYSFCHKGKMDHIQWTGHPEVNMRNLYAVPLTLGGEILGVLKVENRKGDRSFTEQDVSAINSLSQTIAVIAKVLLLLDSHELRLIDAPARLSEALVGPFDTVQLMQEIVNKTADTLNAEVCSLWLVDEGGQYLVHQANFGFAGEKTGVPRYRIDIAPRNDAEIAGITAWVAIRRKAFWANSHAELREHPSWRGNWDPIMWGKHVAERFRSMYAVPLLWKQELLGVLKVENPRGTAYFSSNDHVKCDLMAKYVVLLIVLTKQLKLLLVPDVAHILNTPATAIAALLGELSAELKSANPDLDGMKESVDRLKRETFALATMGRTLTWDIAARVGPQETQPASLVDWLETLLATIRPFAPEGVSIDLTSDGEHRFPMSISDRRKFEVVMYNLLENAMKFSPSGGRIQLRCCHENGDTIISVTDEGPGIAPEHLPHIFEAGFTGGIQGQRAGTGMGLAAVHRLLDELHWSITAGSNSPHGARFEIRVPAQWRKENG